MPLHDAPTDTLANAMHRRVLVDPHHDPSRLDKLLVAKLPEASRSRIQAAIRAGSILVNDAPTKSSYITKPHDVIAVLLPSLPCKEEIIAEALPLDIVYEDDALAVVNKTATMVVHPGCGHPGGTLVNALAHHFGVLPSRDGEKGRPGLVHRIDKGTSGLLVIAKQPNVLTLLARQFATHTVERRYAALVWGEPIPPEGTIRSYLARAAHDRRLMAICKETKGKLAITHYRVVERMAHISHIICTLDTGRTHQIRIHMRSIGHPLFGDPCYGGDRVVRGAAFSKYKVFVQNCFKVLPYQALHAQVLGFDHPCTHKRIRFEVAPPPAFAAVLARWQKYAAHHS